jgi:hypothetical protein
MRKRKGWTIIGPTWKEEEGDQYKKRKSNSKNNTRKGKGWPKVRTTQYEKEEEGDQQHEFE